MRTRHAGVLGATSLVGECLLRQFASNHWQVTAFSRRPITLNLPQISWQQLNRIEPDKADKPQQKISTWICAAPIWILPDYFDFLLAHDAQRIVVLSSTSRFTKSASSDDSERRIARQLINGEEKLQAWATLHGIEWIILRPTLIYGYGRDKNITEIARFIRRFGFFPVLGLAEGLRQPIHAEDVAAACFSALITLNLKNRSYNLTGKETLSYREMVQRIFATLNRPARLLTIPHWLFYVTIWTLRWLPRYAHFSSAMAKRMNQNLTFNSTDAQKDLNFLPKPFQLTAKDLPDDNN